MTERSSTALSDELESVRANYLDICERISRAAEKSGRKSDDVTFLAATKTVEPRIINYAVGLGLRFIGENKVQEMLSKYDDYDLDNCQLHFIGHLQTNKVRQIVGKVSMIQSVDSIKLMSEISKQSLKNDVTTDMLIEVNIGREENKSGVLVENLDEILEAAAQYPNICIKGLMTVPPICDNKPNILKYFDDMYKLFIDISGKTLDNVSMDYLSMGMSDDYEDAILCGANMVRIGSSLFGRRIYR